MRGTNENTTILLYCTDISVSSVQNLEMACMSKLHVTYNTAKRVIAYQKKRVTQGFRRLFLYFFSDVVPSEVTSAEDKFQQYDERFKDYVELQDCEKLDDDKKIRALLSEEQEVKQVLNSVVVSDFETINLGTNQ